MVLMVVQITAFIKDADQMVIPHETVFKLHEEGISGPDDLEDFNKDTLHQVMENLHKPGD